MTEVNRETRARLLFEADMEAMGRLSMPLAWEELPLAEQERWRVLALERPAPTQPAKIEREAFVAGFTWITRFQDNLPTDFELTAEEKDEAYAAYARGEDAWSAGGPNRGGTVMADTMTRDEIRDELINSMDGRIRRLEAALGRVEQIHGQIVHAVHQYHGKPAKPGLETGIEIAASHLLDVVREAR